MAKPKLCLIPAAQGDKFYSVLPSSGVGDFDFTRSGGATRINSQGLIETVADGVSRLNYPLIDGKVVGCPSHFLEPQSTNLVQYSEDFTQGWTTSDATITSNQVISPDGTLNADKVTGSGYLQNVNSLTATNTYTFSFFWKKDTSNVVKILLSSTGTDEQLSINTNTLALISQSGINSYNNISYGNDWYRLSMTWTEANTESTGIRISADESDATSSLFIWGAQLEEQSYATSYIPNYGTALGVTRSAETANNSGDASTFNDSEGVLMAEISALADSGSTRVISLSGGSQSVNNVYISYGSSGSLSCQVLTSGGNNNLSTTNINQADVNKIAIKYKANDFALWLNGIQVDTNTTLSSTPTGLDRINFDFGAGSFDFYGNTKQLQYYDSASLTDSELETLTSWVSFSDMAEGQLYSVE